jgi:hypothetical protein
MNDETHHSDLDGAVIQGVPDVRSRTPVHPRALYPRQSLPLARFPSIARKPSGADHRKAKYAYPEQTCCCHQSLKKADNPPAHTGRDAHATLETTAKGRALQSRRKP